MDYPVVALEHFRGRDAALARIERFGMLKPMFYRTNVLTHSYRVQWLVESMFPTPLRQCVRKAGMHIMNIGNA